MMEAVMGKMPEHFARRGARTKPEFFKEGNKLDWPKPKASRQSKKEVRATRPLRVSVDFLRHPHFHCLSLRLIRALR
jgi:dual-specificity kinase